MRDIPDDVRRVRIIQTPRDGWWRIEYTAGWSGDWLNDWRLYVSRPNEQDALDVATKLKHPNVMEIK